MKQTFKILLFMSIVLFSFSSNSFAQLELPSFISDNMILQQNFQAPIWGWTNPGGKVVVKTSWDNKKVEAEADENGKWQTKLHTPQAGGPFTILINDSLIKNVMIGEVWICSGQSNMQFALRQTNHADEEIHSANFPDIRLFYVARETADVPKKNCYGKWVECEPTTAESFSAVAYFFGKELHQQLNIPIGLIHTSWGGTPAQAWTRKEVLQSDPELSIYLKRFKQKIHNSAPGILPRNQSSPASLYNAMIAPLIPYGIRGAIWYQGEANRKEAKLYERLFPAMIQNWRQDWGLGDFPFYFVQIAPYKYQTPLVGAELRDAQRKTLTVPNTGMAVTLDIGNPNNIHPTNKRDVGKRLALWALAKTYRKPDLVFSGPIYKSHKIEKNKIRISFDHIGSGLAVKGDQLTHFEIAGENKEFLPATAKIERNSVVVSHENIKKPIAVRYAFHNADEPNLFNKEGLPASSFRTDDWPIVTENVVIAGKFDSTSNEFVVSMKCELYPKEIRYTMDGTKPTFQSQIYTKPLRFSETTILKARVFINGVPSVAIAENSFSHHLATGKAIQIIHPYKKRYSAGGDLALVNGIQGSLRFNDGNWQGYEQNNLEAIIDLGSLQPVKKVSVQFYQSINSWIFLPEHVEISFSSDGLNYQIAAKLINEVPADQKGNFIKEFGKQFNTVQTRFIKVKAKNVGVCPDWHPGAGGKAWLFVDEIVVE